MLNKPLKSRTTLASTPQSLVTFQEQQQLQKLAVPSTRKTFYQLLTWETMYGDFTKNLKETIVPLKQNAKRAPVIKDPIETATPLNQPSPFKFNEKLRNGFREFLSGEKTALNLVNECNHMKHLNQQKFRNRVKRVQHANMFAAQLQNNNKYKMLHILGLSDEQVDKKIRVQQKFDKIRKLILKKSQEKQDSEEQPNFKDVQMFRNLFDTCEDQESRFKQKNLLSDRVDGGRDYQNVEYSKNPYGTLRIREDERKLKSSKSVNSVRLKERSALMRQKLKLRDEIDDKLQNMINTKQEKEQETMDKARKNLMRDKHRDRQIFQIYEPDQYHLNEPLSKDVRLYAYLYSKPPQPLHKQKVSKERLCLTERQNESTKKYCANFNQQNQTSRDVSYSDDSSLNSVMEIHIDNLYRSSINLQKTLLENNSEKFVKRIKQFQKVQQLNEQIIKVNKMKLTKRKLL